MSIILITPRLEIQGKNEERESLDVRYIRLIVECGFTPIVVSYKIELYRYFDFFGEHIFGVLLTGGGELESMGGDILQIRREIYEKNLITYCIEHNIAVYGICRGMQTIAEYFGGKNKKVNNQVAIRHNLESKYAQIQAIKNVNSYHNFGVYSLPKDIEITSKYQKYIKSISHKKYRIRAQMWHTERDIKDTSYKYQMEYIRNFFLYDIGEVIKIAQKASRAIMNIYNKDFKVKIKIDTSPLTKADITSNTIITKGLKGISNLPIISEENAENHDYQIRKNYKAFWLIDPLDGTKDFVARNGEFCINIALIIDNEVKLGLIAVPASNKLYFAIKGYGAYEVIDSIWYKIENKRTGVDWIGIKSNFHDTVDTQNFFSKHKINNIISVGSALKYIKIAKGEADIYPRYNGTSEWDIAAADIILRESKCVLVDINTLNGLIYNNPSLRNPYYIACRKDILEKIRNAK